MLTFGLTPPAYFYPSFVTPKFGQRQIFHYGSNEDMRRNEALAKGICQAWLNPNGGAVYDTGTAIEVLTSDRKFGDDDREFDEDSTLLYVYPENPAYPLHELEEQYFPYCISAMVNRARGYE